MINGTRPKPKVLWINALWNLRELFFQCIKTFIDIRYYGLSKGLRYNGFPNKMYHYRIERYTTLYYTTLHYTTVWRGALYYTAVWTGTLHYTTGWRGRPAKLQKYLQESFAPLRRGTLHYSIGWRGTLHYTTGWSLLQNINTS